MISTIKNRTHSKIVTNNKIGYSLSFEANIVAHDEAKIEYVTFLHIPLKCLEKLFICSSKKENIFSASRFSIHCLPVYISLLFFIYRIYFKTFEMSDLFAIPLIIGVCSCGELVFAKYCFNRDSNCLSVNELFDFINSYKAYDSFPIFLPLSS